MKKLGFIFALFMLATPAMAQYDYSPRGQATQAAYRTVQAYRTVIHTGWAEVERAERWGDRWTARELTRFVNEVRHIKRAIDFKVLALFRMALTATQ